jgi:hypothetical protein
VVQRDMTARQRIRSYLRDHGVVVDDSGAATARLREAVAYEGTPLAFIQLIAAMERAGEITREIKGKRTYRIATAEHGSAEKGGAASTLVARASSVDYERLAAAVLREAVRVIGSNAATPHHTADERIAALELQVAEANAARDAALAERDALAARFEAVSEKLSVFTSRTNHAPAARGGEAERALTPAERDLLRRMLTETTIAS